MNSQWFLTKNWFSHLFACTDWLPSKGDWCNFDTALNERWDQFKAQLLCKKCKKEVQLTMIFEQNQIFPLQKTKQKTDSWVSWRICERWINSRCEMRQSSTSVFNWKMLENETYQCFWAKTGLFSLKTKQILTPGCAGWFLMADTTQDGGWDQVETSVFSWKMLEKWNSPIFLSQNRYSVSEIQRITPVRVGGRHNSR